MLQELFQHESGFALLAAPQMDLGEEKLWVREVRRIERARALQVLHGSVELPEFEVRHAKLRVGQRVAWARQRGVNVDLQRFIQLVHGDQYAAQIYQRFVRRRILLQGMTKSLLGQRETVRLIRDRSQRVPGGGELRRQLHRVLQMLLGGLHVALLQIALRVRKSRNRAIGDGEFARGDGVPAAVAGSIEIVLLQDDGKPGRGCASRPG